MAPKRGSGGSGYDTSGEDSVPIHVPPTTVPAFRDAAVILGVTALLAFIIFIFSLFVTKRHPKSHVWRLVATSLFFFALNAALLMADNVVILTRDEVLESYFLIYAWCFMFGLIAQLLLLAACWGFLHNRLRAVGVGGKSVSGLAGLHWFLLGVMSCLSLVCAIGSWLYWALYVTGLKVPRYYMDTMLTFNDYVHGEFYKEHFTNIQAALTVLWWIWVLEMVVVSITLAVKEGRRKPKTYAGLIFILCVLVPLFVATLGMLIKTFQYWTPRQKLLYTPKRQNTYLAIRCIPTVFAYAGLCGVGWYLSREQWVRGNRKQDGAPAEFWDGGPQQQNYNYTGQQQMQQHYPPPQQHYPPPQQYGYPPQQQYMPPPGPPSAQSEPIKYR